MKAYARAEAWVLLLAALAFGTPAQAIVARQTSESKALLALQPGEADQVRRRDLLSALQPVSRFLTDLNGNVYGMTFVTWPYVDGDGYICREDSVTLQYGTHGDQLRQIEVQPLFYVDGHPDLRRWIPFGDHTADWHGCDKDHPGPAANWIAAPTALDAVRAAEMFRMAETNVASGSLKPAPCRRPGPDACHQWILSLNDPSKINAVDTCTPSGGADVCYVISIGDERLTIAAAMSPDHTRPTAITSIEVWRQETVTE